MVTCHIKKNKIRTFVGHFIFFFFSGFSCDGERASHILPLRRKNTSLVTSFPLRRKIPIWSLFDQMRPICRNAVRTGKLGKLGHDFGYFSVLLDSKNPGRF